MKNKLLLLLCLIFCHNIVTKAQNNNPDSLNQSRQTMTVTAVKSITSRFNEGNIAYPLQLLQGRVAGLGITRAGSNPNQPFQFMLRGPRTILGTCEPLYLLNGVPVSDINWIDPQDIEQIEVQQNLSDRAMYGARAAGGIVKIKTKQDTSKFHLHYNSYVAFESVSKYTRNATRADYLAAGGVNLNDDTNWQDEITKDGVSQAHNLGISSHFNNTNLGVSLNYRDQNGMTGLDGFQKINALAYWQQSLFNDRLTFSWNGVFNQRKSDIGIPEVFRYAVTFNPTAPIKDPTNPSAYFEEQKFDYFNPRAILDLSSHSEKQQNILNRLEAAFKINSSLGIHLQYTNENTDNNNQSFYKNGSRFRTYSGVSTGMEQQENSSNNYANAFVSFQKNLNALRISAKLGYDYYNASGTLDWQEGSNFSNNTLDWSQATTKDIKKYTTENQLTGLYLDTKFDIKETYTLALGARREQNSRLGEDNNSGVFYWGNASVNLNKFWKKDNIFQLVAGYANVGLMPNQPYLNITALEVKNYYYQNGGYNLGGYYNNQKANNNLGYEKLREWNVGTKIGLFNNNLALQARLFGGSTTNMIIPTSASDPITGYSTSWANDGEISHNGWELALDYHISRKNWSWHSNLNMYRSTSTYEDIYTSNVGLVGAPGNGNLFYTLQKAGEQVGNLNGYVYTGVDANGNPTFEDFDNDGVITEKDYSNIGQGVPSLNYGFYNAFTFKNFDVQILIRGARGHSKVNAFRLFYENSGMPGYGINQVRTEGYESKLNYSYHHSRTIEKADFLRVENVSLGYTIHNVKKLKQLRIYVAANNLYTSTNYLGLDPDVRYGDFGPADNGGKPFLPAPLVAGVERRNTYLPTKSWVVGVQVGF